VKIVRVLAVLALLAATIVAAGFALESYLQQANIDCGDQHQTTSNQKENAEIGFPLNHLVPPERRHNDPAPPKETHYECLIAKYTSELAAFTKILAYATTALVGATIGLLVLAFFQGRDTKKTVVAAQIAAAAAQRSAESLPIIEGAYVYPNIINVNIAESLGAFQNMEV